MEKENVLEGRGWVSLMNRFPRIMEKVDSYDLTEEQISSLKKKSVLKDKEEEVMEVGEKENGEDNLAMGMDETGIEDGQEMENGEGEVYTEDEEEEGESDGMSEEEEEMEGEEDLHDEEDFSKEDEEEDEDDDDDEEDEPHKAYILVDF